MTSTVLLLPRVTPRALLRLTSSLRHKIMSSELYAQLTLDGGYSERNFEKVMTVFADFDKHDCVLFPIRQAASEAADLTPAALPPQHKRLASTGSAISRIALDEATCHRTLVSAAAAAAAAPTVAARQY